MITEPFGAPSPTAFQALSPDDPREVGGYRLCARLGAGGMGRVYLAYTPGGRPVALKVVRPELAEDPEFRSRFAQEVASARRIHGLYTAQVVDSGTDAVTPWLATTYVPGPSLHQVIHRHGPLPERTVLLLLAGIAEALQVIHLAGVVHRDLKPGNVLVAADGPRVIDFGIARAADAHPLTGTGLRIGSPGFMAPEQALGLPATHRRLRPGRPDLLGRLRHTTVRRRAGGDRPLPGGPRGARPHQPPDRPARPGPELPGQGPRAPPRHRPADRVGPRPPGHRRRAPLRRGLAAPTGQHHRPRPHRPADHALHP
ncbi:protein kinase domain-containing protein [Kitasatospora sp. P5_F3]